MAYEKTVWVNDSPPAINAANLNKMEQGIYDAHQKADNTYTKEESDAAIEAIEEELSTKANQTEVNKKANQSQVDEQAFKIEMLERSSQNINWMYVEDTTPAYEKTLVTNAIGLIADKIGGKSVVLNQLFDASLVPSKIIQHGLTMTNNGDGSFTINGTATANSAITIMTLPKQYNGHKYFFIGCPSGGSKSTYYYGVYGIEVDSGEGGIFTDIYEYSILNIRFDYKTGVMLSNARFTPNLIDLTQMFGAGNEPSTVAEFTAMLKKNYLEYNAGEIRSAIVDKISVVGWNKWDEVTQLGYYRSSDGAYVDGATDRLCSKNFTQVKPNETYYLKYIGGSIVFYDKDKKFVSLSALSANSSFTVPNEVYYVKFNITNTYGTTYNHDICVNLSVTDTTKELHNGVYRPCTKQTYTIPQAIRNLDGYGWSAGSVYNEVDFVNKKFVKRVGAVDLSTLTWTHLSAVSKVWRCSVPNAKITTTGSQVPNLLSKTYTAVSANAFNYVDNTIYQILNQIVFNFVSVDDTKPVGILYYELETPIEIDISEYLDALPLFTAESKGTLTFEQVSEELALPIPNKTDTVVKIA